MSLTSSRFPLLLALVVLSVNIKQSNGDASDPDGYRLPRMQEFLVLAPKVVRPLQTYEMHVSLYRLHYSDLTVRATLSRDGEEYASGFTIFYQEGTKPIQMEVPITALPGKHKLTVEGLVSGGSGKPVFHNETEVIFDTKYVSLFIQTDRPIYYSPDKVQFRIVGVTQELKPVYGSIVIYVVDARGNIVRRWIQKQLNFGMFEAEFDMTYPATPGTWSIRVDGFGHVYEQNFEVVMYYPSERPFEVNVSAPMHIFNTEWGIAGTIFGQHVVSSAASIGNGSISLRVQDENGDFLEGEIYKKLGYIKGFTPFDFTMNEIEEEWGVENVIGKLLVFKGWIYDWTFLTTQNGTCRTRVLRDGVRLEYLGPPVRSFKPGNPTSVYFAVTRSDGTPYMGFHNRQLHITRTGAAEVKKVIPDDGIVPFTFIPSMADKKIEVSAQHPETGDQVNVVLYRYHGFDNKGNLEDKFMSLTSQTTVPKVKHLLTNVLVYRGIVINVPITAGGNVLLGSTLVMNAQQKTFSIAVSRKMAPAAKVIAYCAYEGQIIMDSLSFFVQDTHLMEADMKINYGKDFNRDSIELVLKGDAGSFVGLTGLDYEWYRRGGATFFNKEMVIQELLTYSEHEHGPFRHTWYYDDPRWEESVFYPASVYGMDTITTIERSGLVFLSDMNMTVKQEYTACNLTLGYGRCTSGQCYELSRKCDGHFDCLDGFDEVTCPLVEHKRWKKRPSEILTAGKMARYFDPYYWVWMVTYIKPIGQVEIKLDVPAVTDSSVINAFVMHPENGLSFVREPVQHDTARTFFITCEAPKLIRRGEQVGIRVGVFNNWDQGIEAIVMLHGADTYRFVRVEDYGFVRSYNPRLIAGDVQTMIDMQAKEERFIFMPVVPIIETGHIVVRISGYSPMRHDMQELSIDVTYDGIPSGDYTPYLLDLVNQGSQLIPDFNIPIPERFVDPGSRDILYVPGSNVVSMSVFGDLVMPGFFAPNLNMHMTIGNPHDSADGYMFDFAINLQTLLYLQMINVLQDKDRETALEYMQSILMRQYAYMKDDGSFMMFRRDSEPCVWLTAFILKTLHATVSSQWSEEVYIPIDIINKIAHWLVSIQDESGAFIERNSSYYNRNFWPEVKDKNGVTHTWHIPVTAQAVIALGLADRLTGSAKTAANAASTKGAEYLATKFSLIDDPYQLAITSYALEVTKHRDKDTAYNQLRLLNISGEHMYWANEIIPPNEVNIINTVPIMEPRGDFINLENAVLATSYALKLYLLHNRLSESVPIMKWLVSQHNADVAWASTQDTLMALDALTDYAFRETNRDFFRITINLEGTARRWTESVSLNQTNFAQLYSYDMEYAYGEIRPRAEGTGYAFVAMNAERKLEKPYQVFALGPDYPTYTVDVQSVRFWGRNASSMEMTVCIGWDRTDVAPQSGMTFALIGIPTGYVVTRDVMERLYSANIPHLRRVRFREQQLILFFTTFFPRPTCVTFQAERWYPVANISIPHDLFIKQYGETGFAYETGYETYTLFHLHICQVCGSFQCPYCPYYNSSPGLAPASILISASLIAVLNLLSRIIMLRMWS